MVLLQSSVWAGLTTLYVSPEGNDQWSGRSADPKQNEGPLATLDAARLKIRQLKAADPEGTFEVQLRGGVYSLKETVVFEPEDSGSQAAPVVYKAYPEEEPVFTGGVPIKGWKKMDKDPAGTPEAARGKLWVAEIPKTPGSEWYIRSLYDGETLLNRAASGNLKKREPDQKRTFDFNTHGKGIYQEVRLEFEGPLVEPFERHVDFRDNDLRAWKNMHDIELALTDRGWLRNLIPLERVDVKNKVAHLSVAPTYQPHNFKRPYEVLNAIDYLDEPGEWVVNTLEGKIYMWPKNDVSDMDVIAPLLQEFIRVEGKEKGPFAQHICFEGLTFMHGLRDTLQEDDKGLQHDWEMYDKGNAVIRFRNAEDCAFTSNTIKSSSGTGIRLDMHCQRIEIASNHLKYLGGGGIVLSGYAPGTVDVNKNNVVHDNYIHHVGTLLWHSPAIFIAQSGHNEITHNTIHDLPYNGIVVSGCRPHEFYHINRLPFRRAWMNSIRVEECMPYILKGLESDRPISIDHFLPLLHARENKIVMNDISRVLQKLHDGNAIYFSAMGSNNLAERNYMHQNFGTRGALRLDDNPSYTIIKENVITSCEKGIGVKGLCEIENNFVFTTETFLRGRGASRKPAALKRNIFFPAGSSTSEIGGLYIGSSTKNREGVPLWARVNSSEDNLYFTTHKRDPFLPKTGIGTDLATGKTVVPGKEPVNFLYADPLFDDEAVQQGWFRFKEGSPAEKLGIEPIDLREVGSSLAEKHFPGIDEEASAKSHESHSNSLP
ncbi:hypothetical protein Q31b_47030 [Novipirellula aureliae]|uniref:Periplasmic copper-binding protein NosD beta helix domain-containing protein n=2 Tax=Novipirellula aureliae TaxID=2527966 RepID=A0A5C6DNY3_9BACT|nr:hypothetical protein Q31b_47030 [Novipirellula aureliae]